MIDKLENRINALEAKIAFQDSTIDTLDEQVKKLNEVIEALQLYNKKLEQRIDGIEYSGAQPSIHNDKPPHY